MLARTIFLTLSSIFLIAAIPFAVYLVSQQQILRSQAAFTATPPSIFISGPQVIDYRVNSANVSLTINYPRQNLLPDGFRVANSVRDLENASVQPFIPPTQTINWQLDLTSPTPTIYLQFRINNQWQTPIFTSIVAANNHS